MLYMKDQEIVFSPYFFTGKEIGGNGVVRSSRTLGDIKDIFADSDAVSKMDAGKEVYHVASILPMPEGTPGGIYMGVTCIAPGKVGNEYFMTKGHFHKNPDSVEYYWGVEGQGMLILMDRDGNVWCERMFPGSLHYIPADVAHRVANVGKDELVFAASWPSDAGHDYETIAKTGFARRLVDDNGDPRLV